MWQKFKKIEPEIGFIFVLFLSSRIVLWVIGISSRIFFSDLLGKDTFTRLFNNREVSIHPGYWWLEFFVKWDSNHYISIAKGWYPDVSGFLTTDHIQYAFFPLYPALIRVFTFVTNNYLLSGVVISNIAFLISCILLVKIVRFQYNNDVAVRSLKYMIFFPAAFVFSGVYAESLFFMFLLFCFYFALQKKWNRVGICLFLLTLTKSIGIFMTLPLFLIYYSQKEYSFKKFRFDIIYLSFGAVGALLFFYYVYTKTGDFFAYTHSQELGWGAHLRSPLEGFYWILQDTKHIAPFINAVFTIVVFVFLTLFFKKIGFIYYVTSFLFILVPLMYFGASHLSHIRYVLPIFPLYILLGRLGENKNVDIPLTAILLLLQGFLMVFWGFGFQFVI